MTMSIWKLETTLQASLPTNLPEYVGTGEPLTEHIASSAYPW